MEDRIKRAFEEIAIKYPYLQERDYFDMAQIQKIKKYKKGDYFSKAGEIPKEIGVILKGVCRYFLYDDYGNEHTTLFLIEKMAISSYSAMITNTEQKFNIQFLEDSEVFVYKYKDFNELLNKNFNWFRSFNAMSDEYFIYMENRELSFLLENSQERYLRCIEFFPGIEKRVKQYQIASYLGIKPESLSRIKKNLYCTAKKDLL